MKSEAGKQLVEKMENNQQKEKKTVLYYFQFFFFFLHIFTFIILLFFDNRRFSNFSETYPRNFRKNRPTPRRSSNHSCNSSPAQCFARTPLRITNKPIFGRFSLNFLKGISFQRIPRDFKYLANDNIYCRKKIRLWSEIWKFWAFECIISLNFLKK